MPALVRMDFQESSSSPAGQEIIPVAAVDICDIIFQIGRPGRQVKCSNPVEAIAVRKAEFRKNLIFFGGPDTEFRLERYGASAQVFITIRPLILIGTGQNPTNGKLIIDVISKDTVRQKNQFSFFLSMG
jgi:hypothetical protein